MRNIVLIMLLCGMASSVNAAPPMSTPMSTVASQYVPQPVVVGKGRLSVAFWDVYDASFIAPSSGVSAAVERKGPFALELHYLLDLSGKDIAERTIDEIEGQGFSDKAKLTEWKTQLETIMPDVQDGTRLTGISTAQGETVFYKNDKKVGTISDKEFGRQFFAIWLGEKTSEPALRRNLLGMK